MILLTIQGAALLEFLRHQIVGNLQTRYLTILLQQNIYLTILLQQNTHFTILLQQNKLSYNTAPLKYLLTCRSPPGLGAGGTGQTVAGKKDNSRYFSFLKNICQMENLPLRIFSYESMFSTIFTHWPISVIGRRGDKSSVSIGTIVAPLKRRIVFCPVSFSPPVPNTNFRGVMFKESSSFANVLCLKFAI